MAAAAAQRPTTAAAFAEKSPATEWKTAPSWCIVATADKVIPPEGQQFMARRAGAHTIAIPASHAIALTQPAAVAGFFPISSSGRSISQIAKAKAICAGCPVRRERLAFAVRTHQAHGVWGGPSEHERYPLWSAVLTEVERGQAAETDAVHTPDPR